MLDIVCVLRNNNGRSKELQITGAEPPNIRNHPMYTLRLIYCESVREEEEYYLDEDSEERSFLTFHPDGRSSTLDAGDFESFAAAACHFRENREAILAKATQENPGLQLLEVFVLGPQGSAGPGGYQFLTLWETGWEWDDEPATGAILGVG